MASTESELKEYVKRIFGHPIQRVELTEDQLDDSIADAKRWFSKWKGQIKEMIFTVGGGVNEYILDVEVDDVLEIAPAVSSLDLRVLFQSFNFLEESIPYDLFRTAGMTGGGTYSSFATTVSYIEMTKRLLSADQDWEFNRDLHKLRVFPVPKSGFNLLITYKSSQVDFESLDPRDEDLFRRWVVAEAKMRLGYLRSKFDSYPLAGGDKRLDGEQLKTESKEEKEKLMEEIIGLGGGMGIITG